MKTFDQILLGMLGKYFFFTEKRVTNHKYLSLKILKKKKVGKSMDLHYLLLTTKNYMNLKPTFHKPNLKEVYRK